MKKNLDEAVTNLQSEYEFIPFSKEELADTTTPIVILQKIAKTHEHYFLLESANESESIGRYSYLGYDPMFRLYCRGEEVKVEFYRATSYVTSLVLEVLQNESKPINVLKKITKKFHSTKKVGLPPFTGGFMGYFSYETIQLVEPKLKLKQSDLPIFDLMFYDTLFVFDHLRQRIHRIVNMLEVEKDERKIEKRLEQMGSLIREPLIPTKKKGKEKPPVFTSNRSEELFCNMVKETKKYIYEGDIFQGVISRKYEATYEGDLCFAYRMLRSTNPSAYMYYIHSKELQIMGASPETLVKLVDGKLTTFPVAGTRPRGKDEEEDIRLEQELRLDEKECAEHTMLVDLARNDIGKIATFGSVCVEEYMNIHRFSKVMHIASVVSGTLKEEVDAIDVITTMLPAGTLSGAPKFRACELIDAIEQEPRGIYGGAIGYIALTGNLDVCIAIRTAVKRGNVVSVQAGAGIVADSVPEREFRETKIKANAVMNSLLYVEEVDGVC